MRYARLGLGLAVLSVTSCDHPQPPLTEDGGGNDGNDVASCAYPRRLPVTEAGGFDATASAAGGWAMPVQVAQTGAHHLYANLTGYVLQTWQNSAGTMNLAGCARRFAPNGGWSASVPTPVFFAEAAIASGGDAIGVGLGFPASSQGFTSHAQASLFSVAADEWSSALQVDAEVSPASVASVGAGMDDSGNAMVSFNSRPPGGPYAVKARLHTSDGWSSTIVSLANGSEDTFVVHLAMAPNGTAASVWTQDPATLGAAASFWAARYVPGGWAPPQQFNIGFGSSGNGDVAIDSSGNAMVVWRSNTPLGVWASRNTGAGWSTAVQINTGATNAPTTNANRPILAMNAAGDAVAVWGQFDGNSNFPLWAARFSASSGSWDAPLRIAPDANAPDANAPGRGSAAMDGSGNALIVWENPSTPVHVYASRLLAGTSAWTSPVQLDTLGVPGDAVADAAAACTPTGLCFAAWTQFDRPPNPVAAPSRLYLATLQ